jgi:hypothetical protein
MGQCGCAARGREARGVEATRLQSRALITGAMHDLDPVQCVLQATPNRARANRNQTDAAAKPNRQASSDQGEAVGTGQSLQHATAN